MPISGDAAPATVGADFVGHDEISSRGTQAGSIKDHSSLNFFDTADIYGGPHGRSEEMLGKALGSRRSDIVLATKFGAKRGGGGTFLLEKRQTIRHSQLSKIHTHRPFLERPVRGLVLRA